MMKNLALKSLILLSIVVLSSFTMVDSFMGVKKILGEWDYTIPDAPYEYQKGVLVLKKIDGVLAGEMIIGGQGSAMEEIVYQKNNLRAVMNVQGEIVKFDLNFTKKTLEGTVSYSQGALEMKGTKK
ncbi:hypothetical protein [Lutimonas vermicola]|uniref:DUF306 domain-containing protein n=1 Tax=Lutimonas vermicola TaxID=414288 RepID=A0ABU9L044_9FLAO